MTFAGVEQHKYVPFLLEPDKQIETMEESGVDLQIVTSSAGWHATLDACRFLNDELASLVDRYPRRFAALGHVNLLAGEAALREVERAVGDLRLKGIAIPCFLGAGVNLDAPQLADFYALLTEKAVPLFIHPTLVHSRYSVAPEYQYHPPMIREFDVTTAVARIIYGGVLRNNPGLKIVISHFGGLILMAKERLNMAAKRYGFEQDFEEGFAKLAFDMAGYNGDMSIVHFALQKVSPNKLLFATDFPYNFKKGAVEIRQYIDKISSLELGPNVIDAILGGNAQHLFQIG